MKVIVIGAGAAGMMAAYELTRKGIEVIVLEKSDRIGGRIHTFVSKNFTYRIEAGAEFIHGNLPLTLSLMRKAKLGISVARGKMYRFENGRMTSRFGQGTGWDIFYSELEKLTKDCTLTQFLEKHLPAKKYDPVRREVFEMAQGLDLADADQLSVMSIREEWLSEEMQYRTRTGYSDLLAFLRDNSDSEQFQLRLHETVSKIEWEQGWVKVTTQTSDYSADALVVAVSLGNLQHGRIRFAPQIPETVALFNQIGFGNVIKMLFEFESIFWKEHFPDLGFLFTNDGFTFWSQLSDERPILTGWIGNGYVSKYRHLCDDELTEMALSRLSQAFDPIDVRTQLKANAVFRYDKDSESGGGYSWLKVGSKLAIRKINQGISDAIWFAGEAFHPGAEVGTVEAALQSGRSIARKILSRKKSD